MHFASLPVVNAPKIDVEHKAVLTYQAMADSDDIVLILEHDGAAANDAVIVGSNAAFRRASGYSDDQLLGHMARDLFPDREQADCLMKAVREKGSLRSELACSQAGGATFMLGMHLMPAPARTAGKACFVILGRDITAAVQARQMQEAIQHLLAKVFSSVDAAVLIINGAGRIVMTNRGCDLLLGYAPNALVGRASIEMVVPDARTQVTALVEQHKADEHDLTCSTTVMRADGTDLKVSVSSVIARTADAKKFRIVTVRSIADGSGGSDVRSESVGRIKLVGLDGVRTALGDRWPMMVERVMATAESVIKRHCGPQDSFSRADDTSFLMCFGALSEEESSFRAAMIGREIRNRLIGQGEDADNAYVRSIAAVVRYPDQRESTAAFQATLLNGLDKQIERLEQESRQTLLNVSASSACDLASIFGRDASQVVARQVLIPAKTQHQIVCALAVLPREESQAFDPDGLLFRLAATQAIAGLAKGDVMPLLVEISFEIFATRAATERFFATCAKIDRRVSGRLIVLLSSLPEGLPRSRLQDCINRLRPFCRGVGCLVYDLAEVLRFDVSNGFNPIVALSGAACTGSAAGNLKGLFTSLQSRRAKVLIHETETEKDAAAFRALGADMISMKRPETPTR